MTCGVFCRTCPCQVRLVDAVTMAFYSSNLFDWSEVEVCFMNLTNQFHPWLIIMFKRWLFTTNRIIKDVSGNPLSLHIADSARERLSRILKPTEFLRITVDSGGCHGFQYAIKIDHQEMAEDVVFQEDSVRVVVDEISLPFINGATLDYEQALIGSSFRLIDNPQSTSGCGCGTSFNVIPK